MLFLLRTILYAIGIPAVVLAIFFVLGISNESLVLPKWEMTGADMHRAKSILHGNKQMIGNSSDLILTERDINIACAYLLNIYIDSRSHIQLHDNYMVFKLSLTLLPDNLFGRYLNIRFQLHALKHQSPNIKGLYIGKISIPDNYAGLFVDTAIQYSDLNKYLQFMYKNLKILRIQAQQLHLVYQAPSNGNIHYLFTAKIDGGVLHQYQQKLDEALRKHDPDWRLSLSNVLQPLFLFAQQRSTAENVIAENTRAILIANRYVNRYSNSDAYRQNNTTPQYSVFLYHRIDMAQHFMWSATLSALGNSHLANIISVEKELSDAKKGSGFSFIDLAADRAGMYFGKQATASPELALQIQQKMAHIKNYHAFMPEMRDLPESLSFKAFIQQYQAIDSTKYKKVLQDIDQRIAEHEIYH